MKRFPTVVGPLILVFCLGGCADAGGNDIQADPDTAEILSPDGTRVAYGARDGTAFYTLYLRQLDSSRPRVLYRDTGRILPLEWTPDGQHILAKIYWPGRPERLLLVSVEGSLRLIPEPEEAGFHVVGR